MPRQWAGMVRRHGVVWTRQTNLHRGKRYLKSCQDISYTEQASLPLYVPSCVYAACLHMYAVHATLLPYLYYAFYALPVSSFCLSLCNFSSLLTVYHPHQGQAPLAAVSALHTPACTHYSCLFPIITLIAHSYYITISFRHLPPSLSMSTMSLKHKTFSTTL